MPEWLENSLYELGLFPGALNVGSLCQLHIHFNKFFGPACSVKLDLYSKLISRTIESNMDPPIDDMADQLIDFYNLCHKCGVVSAVGHLIAKMAVAKYILAATKVVHMSRIGNDTKKGLRDLRTASREISMLSRKSKEAVDSYFSGAMMYDMDIALAPTIGTWLGLVASPE